MLEAEWIACNPFHFFREKICQLPLPASLFPIVANLPVFLKGDFTRHLESLCFSLWPAVQLMLVLP